MPYPFRVSRLVLLVASIALPAAAPAQANVFIHSMYGGVEYYTGSTTVGFYVDGDPNERFTDDGWVGRREWSLRVQVW